jgi:olefin beta-lactone synthetase
VIRTEDSRLNRACSAFPDSALLVAGKWPFTGSELRLSDSSRLDSENAEQALNIADHLASMAKNNPNQIALHHPRRSRWLRRLSYESWTYEELQRQTEILARGLTELGIHKGQRTVLMVPPSPEFFSLTFALLRIGAVPVFIDPGMGLRNLRDCLKDAAPDAFIGIPKAHAARLILGWQRGQWQHKIVAGRFFPMAKSLTLIRTLGQKRTENIHATTHASDVAAILFTSGSTGLPKGAVYTQKTFQAQIDCLKNIYGIQPGEVDLCTFPLFALFAPALGMTSVIPEMDFTRPASVNPRSICPVIARFGVTNLFGSPALLKRLLQSDHMVMVSLKRVLSAGAPVPHAVLREFSTRLSPEAQIFTPYGATEALPVCSIGSHEILRETSKETMLGKGVCVGQPVAGISASIIPISDEAMPKWSLSNELPAGAIGEIAVCGPQVTETYFNRDQATQVAKMSDDQGRVWHRMGDLGYKDQAGKIWFCGRKSHRVETSHGLYFTIQCEAVFNTHQAVARTALVRVGDKPVLCVELNKTLPRVKQKKLRRELREIAESFEHTNAIEVFLFHKSFPVDIRHNAKIFREKLQIWAAQCLHA